MGALLQAALARASFKMTVNVVSTSVIRPSQAEAFSSWDSNFASRHRYRFAICRWNLPKL